MSSGNGGSSVAEVRDSLHILPIYRLLISYLSCMYIDGCMPAVHMEAREQLIRGSFISKYFKI